MKAFKDYLAVVKAHKLKTIAVLLVIAVIVIFSNGNGGDDFVEPGLPVVTVTSATKLIGQQNISLVGSVRAFSEAVLTAETSGRVTSVNATLGQSVPTGFIIATLENASEQASVLQAEGVYEAALASAEQGNVSLAEAQTNLKRTQSNAISTFQNAYNTVNDVVRNNIDAFYGNPDSKVPGLKIEGKGQTQYLNQERVAFQTILVNWQTETTALTINSDLSSALNDEASRVDRTIALIDSFIVLFNSKDRDRSYTEAELTSFSANFSSLRSTLQATKNQITNDLANLENANDVVKRAQIGATGSERSVAEAQVKQALGSLRAAQASLAKTIFRAPIPGTINSLNVRVGDFAQNQAVIARVANNNALEIVTFVGDKELSAFSVGSTVLIDNKHEGTVTQVAPAVDPVTKRTEVRVAVESQEIQNGDTVTLSTNVTPQSLVDKPIYIPLSAVKFEIDNGFVFVVENDVLVAKPVVTGTVRGGSVEIKEGLNGTDEFVLDSRGLLADTKVEVRKQ